MHVDLFLPQSKFISNKLVLFQPVILNDCHVVTIGLSKTNQTYLLRGSIWRNLMEDVDQISISKVKTVFTAQSIEIFIK